MDSILFTVLVSLVGFWFVFVFDKEMMVTVPSKEEMSKRGYKDGN